MVGFLMSKRNSKGGVLLLRSVALKWYPNALHAAVYVAVARLRVGGTLGKHSIQKR